MTSQTKDSLRWRPFLRNCRCVNWVIIADVQQYRWRCKTPWRWLEEIQYWSPATQKLLLLQNLLIPSKTPRTSLPNCCCLLPFRVNVVKHLNAGFIESKALSQLRNSYGPPLRLRHRPRFRLRVLSFYEGAVLSSFKKIIDSEPLIMEVQQLLRYFQHRTFAFGSIQWVWDNRPKCETT